MKSVADAVDIPFFIPPMNDGKSHHVISRGKTPKFYRPEDLGDIGQGNTLWVHAFERLLTGLYLALGGPVPYCFVTPDGNIRSLDGGCIKMMLNRTPPDILLNVGADGYISSARPSERLLELFGPIQERLKDEILSAKAS
ncbi:hypothetical protein [Ruixingdingia sedimenti]|uniref:Uncharacterized protein n=1 Tax=Ruixingdingia sedimenti TaxID=3073604 RepID=A0ABU1FDH6_9RHOB|nr:hypothetical protein [Xinfangfangia sp. LG-4]MDR5654907.1 hypothetical protein [Xinfangfangia sp. LG-4]